MKLLTKTTLYFLLAMVPLLAAGGSYLYIEFSKGISNETDEELVYDELQWIQYIREQSQLSPFVLKTPELLIYPVNIQPEPYPTITDTYYFQELANVNVPYRQLSHVVAINDVPYQITIRKSQVQKSLLITNVTRIMLFVFAGLFVATLLFNWLISNKLWKPFRKSLDKISDAELQKMEHIHFDNNTRIEEFNELNQSLNSMTNKIYEDYVSMKEFTEDAAHEMQTPLAVAQTKLELILQDSNLTEEQIGYVIQASEALKRLSKLNQSLLLLAKIENKQYDTAEKINLNSIVKKYLQLFDEVIKDKEVEVTAQYDNDFNIALHPLLAESLVSNLIGNAVKYNYAGGKINVQLGNNLFRISNTSQQPPIEPNQLFKRFKKHNSAAQSANGLGLAIVKKIVDTSQLAITYQAKNNVHEFVVTKK
jgi:signal transduction histidine kinase